MKEYISREKLLQRLHDFNEWCKDGAVWWHDEYCRKCGARMDGDTND